MLSMAADQQLPDMEAFEPDVPYIVTEDGKRIPVSEYLTEPEDNSWLRTPEGKRVRRRDYVEGV